MVHIPDTKELKREGSAEQVWSATSSSEPIKHYVMLIDEQYICTCKGFQFSGKCWHVDKAREL